jgi:hypothetical protein
MFDRQRSHSTFWRSETLHSKSWNSTSPHGTISNNICWSSNCHTCNNFDYDFCSIFRLLLFKQMPLKSNVSFKNLILHKFSINFFICDFFLEMMIDNNGLWSFYYVHIYESWCELIDNRPHPKTNIVMNSAILCMYILRTFKNLDIIENNSS